MGAITTSVKRDFCRCSIKVEGLVQGVGFRPFIYNLACKYHLNGWVCNTSEGVEIEVEGDDTDINGFVEDIRQNPPRLACIEKLEIHELLAFHGYQNFKIKGSHKNGNPIASVSSDISICDSCLKELFDPGDRRYRYPFINCTNCGPRFTIIKDVPYDRENTTMGEFVMCPPCKAEYGDPLNRRFHAQPDACPRCGPELFLLDSRGDRVNSADIIRTVSRLIIKGFIVAIKGIGGYHLACDAINGKAVARLRNRKYREEKPLALMAEETDAIETFCRLTKAEASLIRAPARPIVLLRKRENAALIAEEVAPGNKYLGVMLPYSPLHYLILKAVKRPLVMTSGNRSDEPIAFQDADALSRLADIADYFLIHNREIHQRVDDSVIRIFNGGHLMLRRSRGYVPLAIRLPVSGKQILACGGHLKNTFCLTRTDQAFLSHHIGDLDNLETFRSYERAIEHFKRLFNLNPKIIAYDLHPDYLSTRYALMQEGEKIEIQHHHAHLAACLGENGVTEKSIGVLLDGSGYGTDGRIWGGEFFVGDLTSFDRVAHLDYMPMPGGEKAIKEPYRMAWVYLKEHFGTHAFEVIQRLGMKWDLEKLHILTQMIEQEINCPRTSSMGRLFDAVSAILGIRERINYEGQAAIELETAASERQDHGYPFEILDTFPLRIGVGGIIEGIVDDLMAGVQKSAVAARFHYSISTIILQVCRRIRRNTGFKTVVLSGGVFQNMRLLSLSAEMLKKNGFQVLTHHRVPPNDGGIALGQACIALKRTEA